ncbi:MAG: AI-2E family transporter [Phenylobacterium sp.]|nr:AI-2E family transporter [Phenylobacterium sp.]
MQKTPDSGLSRSFMRRVLFVLGLLLLIVLVVQAHRLLLLAFGAVVVAVLLRTLADPLGRRTPLPGRAAVMVAVVVVLAVLALSSWLFGREVADQTVILSESLPQAWERVQARLGNSALGARFLDELTRLGGETSQVFAMAPRIAASGAAAVTNLLLIVVAGIMLAMNPATYRDGLVMLWPSPLRAQMRDALDATGRALKLWLLGQFVSMTVIGLLTGLGLWLVGVPSPLALGLFAGLAQFVPVVGPLVSAVPGLILSASEGAQVFLWTLAVYVGVQQIESNLITPFVQKRMVQIPMALTLFAVVGFGMFFGPLGVLFATPLAVALFVLVKILYVRDVLGDDVDLAGLSRE